MEILVITWNFPPRRGGIENLMDNLCRRLRKDHSLDVITRAVPVVDCQENWIYHPAWPGLPFFFVYAFAKGCLLLWRKRKTRVIIGGSALMAPLVVVLAKIFRRKAVVHVHGLDLMHPNMLYQAFCVYWLRRCDRVIANSRYTASLAEQKKAKRDLISVIHPAVDAEAFIHFESRDAKKEMRLEGRKVILYVGRLARRKGLKEFIEKSLPKVVAEIPEVCFVVVGENPTESLIHRDDVMGELRALVRDKRLEDYVRLLGSLGDKDLRKIYQASDLLILPALAAKNDVEGFGMVILEAAAAGKPCVATSVGGIPDAIEDGLTGILVEPENHEMISRAIIGLLRDEPDKSVMGKSAQKRVRDKFNWINAIQKYEELLKSLVHER